MNAIKIIGGYAIVLAYVFLLIFGVGNWVKKYQGLETSRKVIHTMLVVVWALLEALFRDTIHQVVIPVLFIGLNILSYRYGIYGSVERIDQNHKGTIYFALAITGIMAVSYWIPGLFLSGGVAVVCLTFGDGAAALIGYHVPSRKIRDHKTLAGMAACILASVIGMIAFKALYHPSLLWQDIFLLALFAAMMELTENGWDNITLSWGVFALAGILINTVDAHLRLALMAAMLIFYIVFLSRAITYAGSILSAGMVFVFAYFGKTAGLGYLLGTYFIIFFIGLIRKKMQGPKKQHETRNGYQILINGGAGTLMMALYGVTADERWLLLCLVAIGGCFIDSISSDVGRLSRHAPYDFLRKIPVPTGISGGVTAMGTGYAGFFSILIGIFAGFVMKFSWTEALLTGVMCFLQTLVDTALGSLLQVKYQCRVCGKLTERKHHCDNPSCYVSGIRWMDNNMVNLLSSAAIIGMTALFLLI